MTRGLCLYCPSAKNNFHFQRVVQTPMADSECGLQCGACDLARLAFGSDHFWLCACAGRGCPGHHRVFSGTPDPHLPDARSTPHL